MTPEHLFERVGDFADGGFRARGVNCAGQQVSIAPRGFG
jgi:hypothetical protein